MRQRDNIPTAAVLGDLVAPFGRLDMVSRHIVGAIEQDLDGRIWRQRAAHVRAWLKTAREA